MLKVGLNAALLNSKNDLSFFVGTRVAAARRALRELHEAKLVIDQFTDAQLVSLGFGDGNNDTDNEIGYGIRDPLVAGEDLYKILNGQTPALAQPTDYDAKLRYVAGGQG